MRILVSPEQMRRHERSLTASGVESLALMERAAEALADCLQEMLGSLRDKCVVCYCGKGNNGGDGLALARILLRRGARPLLRILEGARTEEAAHQFRLVWELGLVPVKERVAAADAAVDALLGTGLNRAPAGEAAQMIDEINCLAAPVLAVDLPSGLNGFTGETYTPCVRANVTLSFQWMKLGHALVREEDTVGDLRVADIGIPLSEAGHISLAECSDLPGLLPPRRPNAHKGSHGRALLYCGSFGMAGAASLAALGCLRAGAGLVRLICDERLIPILQMLVPNATCIKTEDALAGPPAHDVLLAGCGLGRAEGHWSDFLRLYEPGKPCVLDADGLNLLSAHQVPLSAQTLITPHVGEAARLLGMEACEVTRDMPGAALKLYEKYGACVLLKSDKSIIFDGHRMALNAIGSPALAKGGSGDALAGIAAGLMAQGLSAFDAARAASLWLGCAARLMERRDGPYCALTGEILALMGEVSKG